jgi:hypothetical protein
MSKERKKKLSKYDEKFKLDISFIDTIKLAMNTPPTSTIPLSLNEEFQIKNMNGLIVQFVSMKILDSTNEVIVDYYLLVRQEFSDGSLTNPCTAIDIDGNPKKGNFYYNEFEINEPIYITVGTNKSNPQSKKFEIEFTYEPKAKFLERMSSQKK